jgi:hypothetical protein
VTTEDHGDFLLVPVIEKGPIPQDVLAELEEMKKLMESPEISVGPPPLDMPF